MTGMSESGVSFGRLGGRSRRWKSAALALPPVQQTPRARRTRTMATVMGSVSAVAHASSTMTHEILRCLALGAAGLLRVAVELLGFV